jgi:NAD(P)-dependent dehydrogenase (short-subunit alcohol dehydrogenase family)
VTTLRGKTILLTGATRGIGRATALRLAREGARLALSGRDGEALEAVARETRALSGEDVFFHAADLSHDEGPVALYARTREALGPPDVLVNNAGYNSRKAPLWEVGAEEFDAMIAVNLRAPFLLVREALLDMVERKSGHIVNVLSTVCHYANETMGAYTAAKRGLDGLTAVLLKEARPHGIRVTALYPGGTDTDFRPKRRPDYMKPESVAEAIYAVLALPADLVVHGFTFRPMVESNF